MDFLNYKIGKDGIYMSSKEPREGFVAKTYGLNNEKTTYQKSIKQLIGVVDRFYIDEVTFDGATVKLIKLSLRDGDIVHTISAPLKNQKGTNYSDVFTAMISALNAYIPSELVTLTAYYKANTGKDGKEYKNLSVNLNYVNILGDNGKPQWTGFIPYTEIPRAESSIVRGETVWNWDKVMDFYYAKYEELNSKFGTPPSGTSAANSQPVQEETPKAMQPSTDFETPAQKAAPIAANNAATAAVLEDDESENLPF